MRQCTSTAAARLPGSTQGIRRNQDERGWCPTVDTSGDGKITKPGTSGREGALAENGGQDARKEEPG
jgi:hypothetical protein